jgi:hypothetical protein
MISSVLHGIWRWCPLHQLLGIAYRSAGFGKGSSMVEGNFSAGPGCQGSTKEEPTREGESTLLPMLIAGLVTVVVGITVAAFFV